MPGPSVLLRWVVSVTVLTLGSASAAPSIASTPRSQVDVAYEPRGVSIHDGMGRHLVSATRFGCVGELMRLSPEDGAYATRVTPATRAGMRVELQRSSVTEYYDERAGGDERGLEQGFILGSPPPCRTRDQGVMIVIGESREPGESRESPEPRVSADGRTGSLGSFRYADLHARDADDRELPSRLVLEEGALAIRVDDRGARYPIDIDPLWEQQQLLAVAGASGDFGAAVALSGDTAFVSSPGDGSDGEGTVFVFNRTESVWSPGAVLTASDASSQAHLGAAMSLLGDVALFGAPAKNVAGAAYFFTRTGTAWAQGQELSNPIPGHTSFGSVVALGNDAAIIGSDGPVFVYAKQGSSFTLTQTLEPPNADGGTPMSHFGASIAISGTTAVIGSPDTHEALVFLQTGSTWTYQASLAAPGGASAGNVGAIVAISGDTALVSSSIATSIYVFTRTGVTWTLTSTLPVGNYDAVALAISGNLAAAGVASIGGGPPAVEAYGTHAGLLSPDQLVTPSSDTSQLFGSPLAMDGLTLLAGSAGAGAPYIFTYVPKTGSPCADGTQCPTGFCVDQVCCTTSSCPTATTCNAAETCQAESGVCSITPLDDGASCDAGATCTATCAQGACVVGACAAPDAGGCSSTVVCAPTDDCHDFGSCDPVTGACVDAPKADGQPCSLGRCLGGICTAVTPTTLAGGCGCVVPGDASSSVSSVSSVSRAAGLALLLLALAARGYRTPNKR